MTELKTLKDLMPKMMIYGNEVAICECRSIIKAEAIKWVKEFQKERTEAISEMFDNPDKSGIYPTTKFFNRIDNFWKEKFNLTEEDLK